MNEVFAGIRGRETFGQRLHTVMTSRGPLCVGIDAHSALLTRWGLPDSVEGLKRFCGTTVDALADRVAVLKPQSAFFERFGSAGIAVLESTIRHSRNAGALVILDAKRGDIGSTARAYAQAYLDPRSPLFVDALTVNPYLGFGSLAPMLDEAEAHRCGIFVLALTSNPEGGEVQHSRRSDGRTVAQHMIDQAARRNIDAEPVGSVGVVVGATSTGQRPDLTALNGPVLVPGLGAQGGAPEDLRAILGSLSGVVVPSYSRDVLAHGPSVTGLREAAAKALAACQKVLASSHL